MINFRRKFAKASLFATFGLLVSLPSSLAAATLPSMSGASPAMPPISAVARRVTEKIDDSKRVELKGHVVPAANAANDRGAVDGSEHVGLIMLMLSRTPQQQKDLDTLVDQLHNRNSANFHKWLTPQEFGARFSPADEDVAAVQQWLLSKGLSVVEIPPSKTHITVTGTVGQLRDAFKADIHHLSVDGEAHVGTMTEPQIPAALAPVIGGIHKLDDIRPKPLYQKVGVSKRDHQTGKITRLEPTDNSVMAPNFTTTYNSSTAYDLGPQDFYTVYNESPLLSAGITGAGQTIAVIEETQVNPADVTSFRAGFGLPAYPSTPNATLGGVNYIYGTASGVGGDTACVAPETVAAGKTAGDEGEADIDLQWAGAVAPNAIVDFVACGPPLTYSNISNNNLGSSGIDHAAQHIVNYLSGTVTAASLSYGLCESQLSSATNAYYTAQWQQFAAEGITASISSGDSGISACNNGSKYVTVNPQVNGLGSSAYNISAGGTDFSDAYQTDFYSLSPNVWWSSTNGSGESSALSYIPEVAWGGLCSNNLTVSLLAYTKSTTFGSTYTPEAICNNSTAGSSSYGWRASVGGSGGISTINAAPTWQSVYGVGLYSGSTTYRTLPDISLFASSGWWSHALPYCESDEYPCTYTTAVDAYYLAAGGTSYVAPQIAGLMALINQKTNSRQGQANYTLYNLATQEYGTPGSPNTSNLANCSGSGLGASSGSSCIFHDIAPDTPALQTGTNASLWITNGLISSNIVEPCKVSGSGSITDCYRTVGTDTYGLTTIPGAASSTYGYFVGQGYDMVTGLGSVNIANLVNGWTTVSPGFASTSTLSTSAPSVTPTGSVTLTAKIVATGRGGAVAPAGLVDFYLGSTSGTKLGSGAIVAACTGTGVNTSCSGTATLAVSGSSFAVGSNSIIAYFEGDGANDAPSTSAAQTVKVYSKPVGYIDLAVDAYNGTTAVSGADPIYISGWVADAVDGSPLSNVKVYIDGVSVGTPTLGLSRPDVASSTGNASYANSGFTLVTPASGLSAGSHAVTVVATDSGGYSSSFGPATITVTPVYGSPVGHLDQAADATNGSTTVPQSDSLVVSGWAADPADGSPLGNVLVYIDGASVGAPTLGLSRPDVVSASGNSSYGSSGFSLTYDPSKLTIGSHTVTVIATNSHGVSTTLGPNTISVVAGTRPPVGNLDLAVDSGTGSTTVSSGDPLYVSGWAADYQDNGPAQTVSVLIDGTAVGNATLGQARPDVQSANPGQNWNNVGYVYVYPSTSGLPLGTHTVTTVATDSLGITSTFGPVTITVQ